jgi:perosamine synthetase
MLARTAETAPLIEDIVARVASVVDGHQRPIALHEPTLGDLERESVLACLDSGWVSSAGPFISEFEAEVARAAGADYGVAVVNGTAALHAALLVAGVSPGDEVLVPALTFVATANAVCHASAVPHFVDASQDTFGIDPDALRRHLASVAVTRNGQVVNRGTGRPIRALVPVHVFGHLADMPALSKVADEFGLTVVEDATESLGSYVAGGKPALSAPMAILSFNGNKIITTGGGGMILTNSREIATRAKHLTTTAKLPHEWAFEHDRVGYNYRMPNLNAALGLAQMQRLQGFLTRKRILAQRYLDAFDGADGVRAFAAPAHSISNYWLNAIQLDSAHANLRDQTISRLTAEGIMARPIWTPLNRLPMFTELPRAPLPMTDDLAARTINLPSSPFLAGPATA